MHEDPTQGQAFISKVKSDFKNSNLGVLCDLKKLGICQKRFPSTNKNGSTFLIADKIRFKVIGQAYQDEIKFLFS